MRATILLPSRDLNATWLFYQRLGFIVKDREVDHWLELLLEGVSVRFYLEPDLQPLRNRHVVHLKIRSLEIIKPIMLKNYQRSEGDYPGWLLATKEGMHLIDDDGNLLIITSADI